MKKIQIAEQDFLVEGEIIKILEKESKYGGIYYDVMFKLESGNVYRSCIYPNCRNFLNWAEVLHVGNRFSNLRLIEKHHRIFVDADSDFKFVSRGNPKVRELKPVRNTIRKVQEVQECLF